MATACVAVAVLPNTTVLLLYASQKKGAVNSTRRGVSFVDVAL